MIRLRFSRVAPAAGDVLFYIRLRGNPALPDERGLFQAQKKTGAVRRLMLLHPLAGKGSASRPQVNLFVLVAVGRCAWSGRLIVFIES
jgi:hypothetical protein